MNTTTRRLGPRSWQKLQPSPASFFGRNRLLHVARVKDLHDEHRRPVGGESAKVAEHAYSLVQLQGMQAAKQ
jgi:hypothetical protein